MLPTNALRPLAIGAAILALVALASACGGGDDSAPSTDANTFVVQISDDKFSPASLTVPKDTKVKWTWTGSNPHSVVGKFGNKDVSSEQHRRSGSFELTLDTPGTYTYQCGVHPAMTGKIIVQ